MPKRSLGATIELQAATLDFSAEVLPAVAAVLNENGNRLVAELVAGLDSAHELDTPLDRLVVHFYPELSSLLVAHYSEQGRALSQLMSPARLTEMDRRLAALTSALAVTPKLEKVVEQVRSGRWTAAKVFGYFLELYQASLVVDGGQGASKKTSYGYPERMPRAAAELPATGEVPKPGNSPMVASGSTTRQTSARSQSASQSGALLVSQPGQVLQASPFHEILDLLPVADRTCPNCSGPRRVRLGQKAPELLCGAKGCVPEYVRVSVLENFLVAHQVKCHCGASVKVKQVARAAPFVGCSMWPGCRGHTEWPAVFAAIARGGSPAKSSTVTPARVPDVVRPSALDLPRLPGVAEAEKISDWDVDGEHVFRISEGSFDPAELFLVRPRGGLVEVQVNRDHEAFNAIVDTKTGRVDQRVALVLEALAALEVEAGSPKRVDSFRQMRADLSRVLRRIVRKKSVI